jgi:ElaB/YqjD/DUF883 family membrane-anchored ribosome-binding protein
MFDPKIPESGNSLAAQAGPLIDRTAEKASAMAHRGLDAVIEGTDHLRAKAQHAGDSTVEYIRHEPVKAMLMAAAAGAALTALISLLSRSRT